jgi:hypothetical protein
MTSTKELPTPKRRAAEAAGQAAFYSYYAGFSSGFAKALLQELTAKKEGSVFDPWNGAGTTTAACAELGVSAHGSDLNPAMVVVARGRLLASRTAPSVLPLARKIIDAALHGEHVEVASDPLHAWFSQPSVRSLRSLERAVFTTLVSQQGDAELGHARHIVDGSDLACFFYIGLFNTVRALLAPFRTSNPTWLKRPKGGDQKLAPSDAVIHQIFLSSMDALTVALVGGALQPRAEDVSITVAVGNSSAVALESGSVGTVLTSPPYCTRIDYAIATAGELAMLGVSPGAEFEQLRASLMGTSTVRVEAEQSLLWGETCTEFLDRLYEHPSKASKGYYFKSHCQYFESLYCSIGEIARVLKSGGHCAMVVQNSYYKEVLNDLPQICVEMGESHGLGLVDHYPFEVKASFARVNKGARKYAGSGRREWEEVVVLQKI